MCKFFFFLSKEIVVPNLFIQFTSIFNLFQFPGSQPSTLQTSCFDAIYRLFHIFKNNLYNGGLKYIVSQGKLSTVIPFSNHTEINWALHIYFSI